MTSGSQPRTVISADDVRSARRAGELRVVVPPTAIITPLAREEAARWGIELLSAAEAPPPAEARGSKDPEDVERIVARVRGLVPDADPEVIRQIARSVLRRWRE